VIDSNNNYKSSKYNKRSEGLKSSYNRLSIIARSYIYYMALLLVMALVYS
jgi:hypothetical protein